jgi:hypothetical protein
MQLRSKKDHRQKSSTRLTKRPMIKIVAKGVTKLNHGKGNTFQYKLSIMNIRLSIPKEIISNSYLSNHKL